MTVRAEGGLGADMAQSRLNGLDVSAWGDKQLAK
jgi:hypothetical protein